MPKIFISSTFQDMHLERDALQLKLVPQINEKLEPYGESINLIDLRWGINTTELDEEEANKKVLQVCLDEIDNSKPYIIVLIGERYGWIPSSDLMKDELNKKGLILDGDISVTNLEIEYAALQNTDCNVYFYFRNPFDMSKMPKSEQEKYMSESALHKDKLNKLKQKIMAKYPDRIRYYDVKYDSDNNQILGIDNLINLVYSDLINHLLTDAKKFDQLSEFDKARISSKKQFESYYKDAYMIDAVKKEGSIDPLYSKYEINYPLFMLISGKSGQGRKTTLALKYLESLKDDKKVSFPFFYNLNEYTSDVSKFSSFLITILTKFVDLKNKNFSLPEYIARLINEYTRKYNIGINIFVMNASLEVLSFIRSIEVYQSIDSMVAFYVEMDEYKDYPLPYYKRNYHLILENLTVKEKIGIINKLSLKKNKQLSLNVINEILMKKTSNPLYISLLVEKLLSFTKDDYNKIYADNNKNIDEYIIEVIKNTKDSIIDISQDLLMTLKNRINNKMIDILISIFSYDISLTDDEIKEFFKYKNWEYDGLTLSLFKNLYPKLFTNDLTEISFINNDVRIAARNISKIDYSLDLLDWMRDDKVTKQKMSYKVPNLLIQKNLYKQYLDDIIYFQAINYSKKIKDVKDIGDVDFIYYLALLGSAVFDNKEFVINVHKEFINRIIDNKCDISVINILGSIFEVYNDFNDRINKLIDCYHDILKLYYDEYNLNKDNDNMRFAYLYIVFRSNNINNFRSFITEERKDILVMMKGGPEDIAFLTERMQGDQSFQSYLTLSTLLGLYNWIINGYTTSDNAILENIKYGIKIACTEFENQEFYNDILNGKIKELNDNAESYNYLVMSLYFMIKLLIIKYEEKDLDYFEIINKTLRMLSTYIINNSENLNRIALYTQIYTILSELFFMYQEKSMPDVVQEKFVTIKSLNNRIRDALLLIISKQCHDIDAIRVLLAGYNYRLVYLDDTHELHIMSMIDMILNSSNDKRLLHFTVFLVSLSLCLCKEEKDELFKEIFVKEFKNMNELDTYDNDEDSINEYMIHEIYSYLRYQHRTEEIEFIDKIYEYSKENGFVIDKTIIIDEYKDFLKNN